MGKVNRQSELPARLKWPAKPLISYHSFLALQSLHIAPFETMKLAIFCALLALLVLSAQALVAEDHNILSNLLGKILHVWERDLQPFYTSMLDLFFPPQMCTRTS